MASPLTSPRNPLQYQLQITKCPEVAFWCQAVVLPTLTATTIDQKTPFMAVPFTLDTHITVGALQVNFLVDEHLSNYQEIYNWMRGATAPTGFEDYNAWRDEHPARWARDVQSVVTSEATVLVNDSDNRMTHKIRFPDVLPTSLGSLSFDTTSGGVTFMTCRVTFAIGGFFSIERIRA